MLKNGGSIKEVGASLGRQTTNTHIVIGGDQGDLSVDQLLDQLAKKGKKIKVLGDEGEDSFQEDPEGEDGQSPVQKSSRRERQ
jgi:hypothetical protein